MLFMVIERFKDRDPGPVYARLREAGRSLPDGLRYVDSWVEVNFDRCFQLMECDDPQLLMKASPKQPRYGHEHQGFLGFRTS